MPIFQLTFGFVWNRLEIFDLDGHNLAQFSFGKNSEIFFLNRSFWHQNHHFKPKKRDFF